MLDKLTIEDFARYVGGTFIIQVNEEAAVPAELIEAKSLGKADENKEPAVRVPFSIIFRTADQTLLPQSIYEIKHENMGELQIFLVPVGPDRVGMCYQAVFA